MNLSKKSVRGVLIALLLLTLSIPLGILASAEEMPVTTPPVTSTVSMSAPAEAAPVTTVPPEASDDSYTPISAALGKFLGENAAPLLSGATFLLTLILTLILRKRIVPSLLSALAGLVAKSRETLEETAALKDSERARLTALADSAAEAIQKASLAAERAEAAAHAALTSTEGRRELARVMRDQAALLYELLMSANLPQYQKERIGTAYAQSLALLGESGDD